MTTIDKYFTKKYLKGTCFSSISELLKDKTSVFANAPRALIAVELKGTLRALRDPNIALQK